MQFSNREASIMLGATLVHWGVPFRFSPKREITEHQQEVLDQASEKVAAVRAAYLRSQSRDVDLSDSEIALLADVIEDCAKECGSDAVELRLQLHADEPREVEALIERLRSCNLSAR